MLKFKSLIVIAFILGFSQPAGAMPENDEEKIPSLYWGVSEVKKLKLNTGLISFREEYKAFQEGFNKHPIPYPITAMIAPLERDRYWGIGNKIYFYDAKSRQSRVLYNDTHQSGDWKVWSLEDVRRSPTGNFISFVEYLVKKKKGQPAEYRPTLAVLDLKKRTVQRFDAFRTLGEWAPNKDRLAFVPGCRPSGSYRLTPCGGVVLVNGDGTRRAVIAQDKLIEDVSWQDDNRLLFWHNTQFFGKISESDETNAIQIFTSDSKLETVYNFRQHHMSFRDLNLVSYTREKDKFLYSVENSDDNSQSLNEAVHLVDLNGQTKFTFDHLSSLTIGYHGFSLSPDSKFLAIQDECDSYSIYCKDSVVVDVKSGQRVYFKGYFQLFWVNDSQLLMIKAKDSNSEPKDILDISLLRFGELAEVNYYRLNIGEKSGLKRGDILSVYSNAKMNRVTGEDEGYDPKSLKGKLILVKVDQNSALAIKYVSNDVDLKSGYLVSDDQIQGKISGFEKSTEKY